MKNKWFSIFTFLIITGVLFTFMYWVQNHSKELKMEDLEKIVEKELIEFHSK